MDTYQIIKYVSLNRGPVSADIKKVLQGYRLCGYGIPAALLTLSSIHAYIDHNIGFNCYNHREYLLTFVSSFLILTDELCSCLISRKCIAVILHAVPHSFSFDGKFFLFCGFPTKICCHLYLAPHTSIEKITL